jgi:hypothetical protein
MKFTRSTRDRSGSSLLEAKILATTRALCRYKHFLCIGALFCSVIAVQAQSRVTLAWDRNSEANITGYRLYCGTVTRVYTDIVNAGNATTASVSNLLPGVTYRFAVTAINTLGVESDYSSEVAFTTTNIVTPNIPPTLSSLANLTINEDAGAQTVLLTGISPGPENQTVTVTASASPQSLIPSVQTAYVSPRTTGTVSFATAPNMSGSGTVTVIVSDGLAQTVRSFAVTVNPVDDAPTIANIADRTIDQNTATGPIGFVIGDAETAASSLVLSASSSNPSLVPIQNIVFGGSGSSRTVNVTPATNQTGAAMINITVSDGALTATDSFVLTVSATPTTNTPPALSAIRSTTIFSGGSSLPLRFSVSDSETPTEALQVWAVSSNPTLIPANNILFEGSGPNRTLKVAATNGVGNATIILSANDGSGNTRSTNFGVSVVARPAQLVYLPFEAEDGSIVAPMQLYTDSSATYVATPSANAGTVSFQVSIAEPGNYIIWARHLSPDSGRDSFFVSVDGVEIPYATAIGTWSPDWQWTRVTVPDSASTRDPRVLSLSVGTHTVTFRGSEASCGLDRIIICNDLEFVPGVGGNTAPGISSFSARTINEDTSTGPIAFTVSDPETPGSLVINTSSSNPSLVPTANMTIGGTGTDRTLTVTPALNQSGTATITVSVSDGQLSASSSFVLTVNAMNDTPTIAALPAATVPLNIPTALQPVVIADIDTAASSLVVTGTSSDTNVLPNANIILGTVGLSRTLSVHPLQPGSATVTLRVSDGLAQSAQSFLLTVTNIVTTNAPPTLNPIANVTMNEDSGLRVVPLTGISAGASENQALSVSVSATPSSLIPTPQVSYTSPSATGVVSFVTATNMSGSGTVTVTVSDGIAATARTFSVTVNPVNDPPGLTSLGSRRINENTTTGPIGFTIGDVETPASNLMLSGTSSNPTLVPQGNIAFGGSSSNRTVQVTPAAGQLGTAMITVWVSDGALAGSRAFELTVTETNDAPTMAPLANASVPVKTVSMLSPVEIGDVDSTNLVVTGTSSDTGVLPNGNILIGTSGLSRTLSVRPQRPGTTTVTLTVSDGYAQSSQSFLLTVTNRFKLRPSDLAASSAGGFTISWESLPGDTYRVMANSDLTYTNWVSVSGNLTAVGETTAWTDNAAATRRTCFYLIELVSPE